MATVRIPHIVDEEIKKASTHHEWVQPRITEILKQMKHDPMIGSFEIDEEPNLFAYPVELYLLKFTYVNGIVTLVEFVQDRHTCCE